MIYHYHELSDALARVTQEDIIVFPTDTVYGIGASIYSPQAIQEIFEIKQRPTDKSLIVLCANKKQLEEIVGPLSSDIEGLVDRFLPGALTLVLNCCKSLCKEITRGKQTIGVRIPNHPVSIQLLNQLGPLATTSANVSGEPSPTKVEKSNPIMNQVPYVFDIGETEAGVPSTILDCTTSEYKILREGAIPAEDIYTFLNKK